MAVADRHGLPVAVSIESATPHEVKLAESALLQMVINGVSAIPVLLAAALADNIGTAQVLGGLGVLLLGGGLGVIAGGKRAPAPSARPPLSVQ